MSTDHSSLPSVLDVKSKWEQMTESEDGTKDSSIPRFRTTKSFMVEKEASAFQRQSGSSPNLLSSALETESEVSRGKSKPIVAPKPARLSSTFAALSISDKKQEASGILRSFTTPEPVSTVVKTTCTALPQGSVSPKQPPAPPPPRVPSPRPATGSSVLPVPPSATGQRLLVPLTRVTHEVNAASVEVAPFPPPPPPRKSSPSILQHQIALKSLISSPVIVTSPAVDEEHYQDGYFASRPQQQNIPQRSVSETIMPPPPPPPPARRMQNSSSNPHLPLTTQINDLLAAPKLPPRPSRSVSPHTRISFNINNNNEINSPPIGQAGQTSPSIISPPSMPLVHVPASIQESTSTRDSSGEEEIEDDSTTFDSGHPDSSQSNRRAPIYPGILHSIPVKGGEVKSTTVLGSFVCVCSNSTSIYDLQSGESLWTMSHPDVRVTAAGFRPMNDPQLDGRVIWLGTREGQLWEINIDYPGISNKRVNVHLTPLVLIHRCGNIVWTLSDDGKLCIWEGELSSTPKTYRVTPNFKAFAAVGSQLWIGRNRQTNIYQPSPSNTATFCLTPRPIPAYTNPSGRNSGEFSCAGYLARFPDYVFFGHDDGTVTAYSQSKMVALESINLSIHKVCAIRGVGQHLWIGLKSGNILVCDITHRPWKVMKDWKAHEGPVNSIQCDDASLWQSSALPVLSFGTESAVSVWDGLLKHDWIEMDMNKHDEEFCSFSDLKVRILTWNAGAAKPSDLEANKVDGEFLRNTLLYHGLDNLPEVLVFGFQELVQLDKTSVTAKSMFSKRKKDKEAAVSVSSHISHQYKDWQDRLFFAICNAYEESYKLVHSSNMVGLFTCVFVKESLIPRLRGVESSDVKTGLGGYHGNKGGLAVRMMIDDSSLCFVNCHLAAGQSNALHRNKDIETILETQFLDESANTKYAGKGIFVNGGDGTKILDHEICFFSGDMNYRINMQRQVATKAIQENEFEKLLESDQLTNQLRKNPGMRLRVFQESQITFAPTYKFDVGTDNYDSSEKKRVPAWCDRIFYRGGSRVSPLDYQSHLVRVSDHRPVSGLFKVQLKTIEPTRRAEAYKQCLDRWKEYLEGAVAMSRSMN